MRAAIVALLLPIALVGPAASQTLFIVTDLTGRVAGANGPESWLTGGFGRLDAGGGNERGDARAEGFGTAQLGVDWNPSSYFGVHLHALARREPSRYGGRSSGVPEAYVQLRMPAGDGRLQLRAGALFLPTSRENVDDLWSSPYTITLSAINTWIAHEFRPVGADLEWKREPVTIAATAFRGNDASGALLAWRGFAIGNRLAVYNEVVPLPPLVSIHDPRLFGDQRPDGTKPFGTDLDGRTGFAGRIRWQVPDRGMIQLAHADNRGARTLHRGEYAWETRFDVLGGEIGSRDATIVVAEYMKGDTGMGAAAPLPFVQASFDTAYLLVSHKRDRNRLSVRIESFATDDRDRSAGESNQERGGAWAVAWMRDFGPRIRAALEFASITGRRPAAAESGFPPGTGAQTLIVEIRYRFAKS